MSYAEKDEHKKKERPDILRRSLLSCVFQSNISELSVPLNEPPAAIVPLI